jgi:AbrB family looped-hinge helix DNA binding protein
MHTGHFPKILGATTLNEKGQLVIPVEARKSLGLKAGDRIVIMSSSSKKPALLLIKAEALEALAEKLTNILNDTKN